MRDQDKTKEQLVDELEGMRQKVAFLERTELERDRTHRALQEANERLELALKAGNCGLWEYNVQTGEALFSKQRAEMLGYSLEELEPHVSGWGRLVHPEDVPQVIAALNRHLEGRSDSYESRHRLRSKSGEWRWILARGRVVEYDKEGKPLRFVGTSLDITDRKVAEDALKKAHDELELRVQERTADLTRINQELLREIAERVRAEKDLDLERKQLLSIFDSINEVISVIDAETYEILYVNKFVRDSYGKDLVGGLCYEELHGLERPCDHCKKEVAIGLDGEPYQWDYHNPTRDKSYLATDRIIRWSDGRKAKFHLGIDVTERRRVMEALAESEQRYRRLFEHAPLMYIITRNEQGVPFISDCNERFLLAAGYTREEVVGQPLAKFYSPASQFALLEGGGYAQALAGVFLIGERELLTRDGRLISTLLYTATELDPAGQVSGTRAMFVDITELKRAEEALRAASAYNRRLIESSLDPLVTISADGKINDVNAATEKVTGFSRDELIGKDFADHFLDRSRASEGYQKAFAEGSLKDYELQIRHKDGHVTPVVYNATVYYDHVGKVAGLLAIARDLTERKLAEDLVRIRLELLEYSASHSVDELLQKTLDEIGSLTESPIGFYHFVGEDEKTINLRIWSTKTMQEFCQAEGTGRHYPVDQAGVWADAVRQRRPVIHNDYASLSHRKGMPAGHAAVTRELVVPIMKSDRIVAVLGIGNKATLYTEKDVEVVSYLADVAWETARRKRVEEAIRTSEERLELALHGADLGLWDLHIPTGEAVTNQRTAEIVGYSLDEIEPTLSSWERFLHPDDRQRALDAFYNHLAGLTSFAEEEYRVRHKSGDWKWVLSRGRVTERDQEGNPLRMSGTYLDITEKKVAETLASEANELREKIVSASPMGIAVYRADGQCISANEALGRILGSGREGLLLQNFRDLAPWKDTGLLADAEKVLSEGMNNQSEVQFTSTFGKPVWVNARMARLNLGGQPHLLMVLNDISERRKAETALKFEREQLLSLFESIDEVILVIDPRTHEILYANKFTEDLYGKKLVGGTCHERLNGFPTPCGHCHNEKIAHLTGQPYQWEYSNRLLKKDFLATDRMIRWPDGRDVKFQIAIDITERNEAQQEHDHLRAQLFQAQKMEAIGTLAGGVAHDFNNILQVALGYSELMLTDEDLPDRFRPDIQKMHESAMRGADLVQRLLTFSRKAETKPRPLNLNRRLNEMRKMLERTIPKMIEIELLLDENPPTIIADATQVDQILMNLAVNARDAMREGGRLIFETANVIVDEESAASHPGVAPGHYLLLRVTDTGVGMGQETLEHIFEPFFTTKGVGEGTGLGLAVVYGIVHQHDGHITCASRPHVGTTFNIYLPAAPMEATMEAPAGRSLVLGGAETILLVDDEETVRDLGRQILERSGYTVLLAANGKEALDVYARERDKISLVILDIIMPEMGGEQCLEELLRIDPRMKTLIASGLIANSETVRAMENLAKGFVSKPYQRTQLLQIVRAVLDAK